MTTRKPALPPQSHIALALAVTEAIAGASAEDVESLPAKVRESLDYFTEVADTAEAIRTRQVDSLRDYRDEAAEALAGANTLLDAAAARGLVDALFSSHVMARLIADVAAGNVEPVAAAPKTSPAKPAAKKATAKKTAPAKPAGRKARAQGEGEGAESSAGEPSPGPTGEDTPPSVEPDVTAPASDLVDDEPSSEPDLPVDPEDAPSAQPTAPKPAPPRGAPPAGVRPLSTIGDDDF